MTGCDDNVGREGGVVAAERGAEEGRCPASASIAATAISASVDGSWEVISDVSELLFCVLDGDPSTERPFSGPSSDPLRREALPGINFFNIASSSQFGVLIPRRR